MSVNKVTLIGRVGKKPEVRTIGENNKVANFSLATSEKYTKNNQPVEETEWHSIVVYGRLAEVVEKYVDSGSHLYVEGRIKTRTYTTQDGANHKVTEIIAGAIEMLGSKSSGNTQNASAPASAPAPNTDDLPF